MIFGIKWIKYELKKGITPTQILEHAANTVLVASNGGLDTSHVEERNHFITKSNIYNIKNKLDHEIFWHNDNDIHSLHLWTLNNSDCVLFYDKPKSDLKNPLQLGYKHQLNWIC